MILPYEIINYIISYTYQLQPTNLLEDIKNFSYVKEKMKNKKKNIISILAISSNRAEQIFLNQLHIFYNCKILHSEYCDHFYETFHRNKFLINKKQIDNYFKRIKKETDNHQINILLGLLTPNERNEYIENFLHIR